MAIAAAAVLAVFLAIYLTQLGHGFISDDFRWIVESRVAGFGDLVSLMTSNTGFYRPLVKLSFAIDYALWGTWAFGYALTNVALCLGIAVAFYALARRFGVAPPAALLATAAWLLNFHAVNMALLWLSGRTSLLVSLFALLTAHAAVRGRALLAGLAAVAAMLAKEEAVALPALFSAHAALTERRPIALLRPWPQWLALAAYAVLRAGSGAFWVSDAPSYYQFVTSPPALARNVLEYADRAGTIFVVAGIVIALAGRVRLASLARDNREALTFAALWIAATFALTVLLPVRSSLYALLPSLGTALALGVVASAAFRVEPRRARNAAVALLAITALLVPVYRARNLRWVQTADLAAHAVATIAADVRGRPAGRVVLVDDPAERFNLTSAFGAHLPEALTLFAGEGWTGEIVADPGAVVEGADVSYRLTDGRLVRLGAPH